MKFLTDENVAALVVQRIRAGGFDVKDIKEEQLSGSSDVHVLSMAKREQRVIITHDKDFAQVSFYKKVGVILMRCRHQDPETVSSVLLHVLLSGVLNQLHGKIAIISEDNIIIK
ncbi:DUF5615 family PIN-like protein [Candidatus Woesearchaeota archaeon]|nr:DUF5615 family PIN-like protein [Candidatus Woesearchaeota archaeon]